MKPSSKRPLIFASLCGLYGLLTFLGYLLFGEAQWVRDIKATPVWIENFASLEKWVKGVDKASGDAQTLVLVGQIRGEDALLVRDFSSLVFRSAHENEYLTGRNVLFTKEGVHARLWLVDYDTWLEMQPNTLIVLDQSRRSSGEKPTLSLSVLAGGWNLKEVQESEVEAVQSPKIREQLKVRRETRKIASQGRDPSSTPAAKAAEPILPGIQIQDFVKMKEYAVEDAGVLSEERELKPLVQAQARSESKPESIEEESLAENEEAEALENSFWGESASLEGGSLESPMVSELKTLAKALQVQAEEDASRLQNEAPLEPLKAPESVVVQESPAAVKKGKQKKGSLRNLDEVFAAETRYIASALKTQKGERSPASAIGLSMALEQASSKSGRFGPALAQVLSAYTELYVSRGECKMLRELYTHVRAHYPADAERVAWEGQWTQLVKNSSCSTVIQARNESQMGNAFVAETRYIRGSVGGRGLASTSKARLGEAGDAKFGKSFSHALAHALDAEIEEYLAGQDCQKASEILLNAQNSYAENTILLNWKAKWSRRIESAACSR